LSGIGAGQGTVEPSMLPAGVLRHLLRLPFSRRFADAASRRGPSTGAGLVGKTGVSGLHDRHGTDGHSTVRAKVVPKRSPQEP